MSIITERLLSQINEETLNEAKGSRKDSKGEPASGVKTAPSTDTPKSGMSAVLDKTSTPAKNAYKFAKVNENGKFLTIKISVDNFAKNLRNNDDIGDKEKKKALQKINAAFLYKVGWDLFDKAAGKTRLKLSPDGVGKVKGGELLPKGKSWDNEASKEVYDNRTNKNTTLYYYWSLINPTRTAIDKPHMILDKDGIRVVMAVTIKNKEFSKAANLDKGADLLNLPKSKNDLKLIDLINIAKAWDDFDEDALRADIKGTKIASRGAKGRRRRVRRAVSTAAALPSYNIRKPKPSGFVGNYQGNLKKFYTNIPRLTGVAGGYKPGKLTDSKYGYRTHYMGVITANEIIKQLRDHIEISVKKESNEKRIANLSQLLESKLLGFNTELLVEQNENKLKELLEKLTKIQSALREQGGTPRTRPTEDKFVQGQLLKQYNDILSKLVFKDGKIDFDATLKAMEEKPAVAAKGEPAKPAKEVVKRPSEGSCFYAIDRTISGVTDMSPTKIWASVGESWDNWYKEALELLEDEAASSQFYYLSGPQSSYLGVVKSMDKAAKAALNINLFCVSRYMEKFLLNLEGNGIAAQNLAQSKKEPVQNYSNFVGQDGTFATSRANKLAIVIRKVLAAIPKLRKNQNQNAIVTGDKGLATTQQQAAAQDKAAAIATKPSKAVAVGARGAAKPAAKAPLGTQNNPFKDRSAWLQWQTKTPAEQRKNNVVYFVYPDKDGKPLFQKIEYDANGNIKPTATAKAASAATQKESIKQKREKLLNEAIFKKLVK